MLDLDIVVKSRKAMPVLKRHILYLAGEDSPFRAETVKAVLDTARGRDSSLQVSETDDVNQTYMSSLFGDTLYVIRDDSVADRLDMSRVSGRLFVIYSGNDCPLDRKQFTLVENAVPSKDTVDAFVEYSIPEDSEVRKSSNWDTAVGMVKGWVSCDKPSAYECLSLLERIRYEFWNPDTASVDISYLQKQVSGGKEQKFVSILEPLWKTIQDYRSFPDLAKVLPSQPKGIMAVLYKGVQELMMVSKDCNPSQKFPENYSQYRVQQNARLQLSSVRLLRVIQTLCVKEPEIMMSESPLTFLYTVFKEL